MADHTVKAFDEDITRIRGLIAEMGGLAEVAVHEAMDSVAILDQIAGRPVGTVFAQAVAATRP